MVANSPLCPWISRKLLSCVAFLAPLLLWAAPQIVVPPLTKVAQVGQEVRFEVNAQGTGALTYQWTRNGRAIQGATQAALVLPSVVLQDRGFYEVTVRDTSSVAAHSVCHLHIGVADPVAVAFGPPAEVMPSLTKVVHIDYQPSGRKFLALNSDGSILEWSTSPNEPNTLPEGLSPCVAVAAGPAYSMGVKADGTVQTWGTVNEMRAPPTDLKGVVAVASAGSDLQASLHHDGRVTAWGTAQMQRFVIRELMTEIVALVGGADFLAGLKADGTVVTWHRNYLYGGTAPASAPAVVRDVVQLAAGFSNLIALKNDGSVVVWEQSTGVLSKVPSEVVGVKNIAIMGGYSVVVLSDGRVFRWANGTISSGFELAPPPSDLQDVVSLQFQCAITESKAPNIRIKDAVAVPVAGESFALSAEWSGSYAFQYQWYKNGAPVADDTRLKGSKTPVLHFCPILVEDEGEYSIKLTNPKGEAASSPLTLRMLRPPTITSRPLSRLLKVGEDVTFSIGATSDKPISYEWKLNGHAIPGATTASYRIAAVAHEDAGRYEVILSNMDAKAYSVFNVATTKVPLESLNTVLSQSTISDNWRTPADLSKIVDVAVGGSFAIGSQNDGSVVFWGGNWAPFDAPERFDNVVAVAAGTSFSVVLKADGTMFAWNMYPGPGETTVARACGVVSIAASGSRILALKADGTVQVWQSEPPPSDLKEVVSIAAGEVGCLALTKSGKVVCWSSLSTAVSQIPDDLYNIKSLAINNYSALALDAQGRVRSWGYSNFVPTGLSKIVRIAANGVNAQALDENGLLVRWTTSIGGATHTGVAVTGLGKEHSLMLRYFGKPVVVAAPSTVQATEGNRLSFGLSLLGSDSYTVRWFKDGVLLPYQVNPIVESANISIEDSGTYIAEVTNSRGTTTSPPIKVEIRTSPIFTKKPLTRLVVTGQAIALSVEATNAVSYTWKRNGRAIVGGEDGTLLYGPVDDSHAGFYKVTARSADGGEASTAFHLKVCPQAGSVVGWGKSLKNVGFPALANAAEIAAVVGNLLVLKADGTVTSWGTANRTIPQGLGGIVAIANGDQHSIALKSDGTVVTWANDETTVSHAPPPGLSDVIAICASGSRSVALKANGTVAIWGSSVGGSPITLPEVPTGVVAIAAGADHYMFLKEDGSVAVWGSSPNGKVLQVPPLSDVTAISSFWHYCFATRAEGLVWAWGEPYEGLVPAPSSLRVSNVRSVSSNYGMAFIVEKSGALTTWSAPAQESLRSQPPDLPPVLQVANDQERVYALIARASTPPSIAAQPANVSVIAGDDVMLSVTPAGTPPFTYRWFKNGTELYSAPAVTSASGSRLLLKGALASDAAAYSVVVENPYGSATSALATVTVQVHTVTATGVPTAGGETSLSVTAPGATTYQWRFRGSPIAGATNATLQLNALSRFQNGNYDVVLGFPNGSRVSHAYSLNVAPSVSADFFERDPNYGPMLEREGAGSILTALALPDGRFLVGGDFTRLDGKSAAYMARLNSDGSLDASFVAPKLSGPVHVLQSQPDGRILVGGEFGYVENKRVPGLIRLTAGFELDAGFLPELNSAASVYALARQEDGRWLVGGNLLFRSSDKTWGLVRLMEDGRRDSLFTGTSYTPIRRIHVLADGRIVFAGWSADSGVAGRTASHWRLNADGSSDATWKGGTTERTLCGLERLPDGRWLLAHLGDTYSTKRLERRSADGVVESGFVLDPDSSYQAKRITFMHSLPDGKVLLAGDGLPLIKIDSSSGKRDVSLPPSSFDTILPRCALVMPDGTRRLFGSLVRVNDGPSQAGMLGTNEDSTQWLAGRSMPVHGEASVEWLLPGPSGSAYVCGDFTHVNGVSMPRLARLFSDGALDEGFKPAVLPGAGDASKMLIWADGRLFVHNGAALYRLHTDGRLDDGFSPAAFVPRDTLLDRDGGLLISSNVNAGLFTDAPGILRLNAATGVRDASFAVTVSARVGDLIQRNDGRILIGGGYNTVNGILQTPTSYYRLISPTGVLDERNWAEKQMIECRFRSGIGGRVFGFNSYDVVAYSDAGVQTPFYQLLLPFIEQPDGRCIYARKPGIATEQLEEGRRLLVRVNMDGSGDSVFRVGGLDGWRSRIDQILLQDDGALLVAGTQLSAPGERRIGLARLKTASIPVIARQPVSVVAELGGSAEFSVQATGSLNLSYQWLRDDQIIPGASSAVLRIDSLKVSDGGSYTVRIGNFFGSAISAPASLTGSRPAPAILRQPASFEVIAGGEALFSVQAKAAAGGSLTYQWRRQGFPIAGATAATFSLGAARLYDAGLYDVVVSDGLSKTRSDNCQLTVQPHRLPSHYVPDLSFAPQFEVWGGSVSALMPAPDGTLVVNGDFSRLGGVPRAGLAKVDAAMNVVPGFIPDASLIQPVLFAVDAAGRLLVGSKRADPERKDLATYLVRLNADGSRDTSFSVPASLGGVLKAIPLRDGSTLIFQFWINGSGSQARLLRADGTVDEGFNPIFRYFITPTWEENALVQHVVEQPDGKIVVHGGFNRVNGVVMSYWVRLDRSGQIDNGFTTPALELSNFSQMVVLPDGKLVLGGSFPGINGTPLVVQLTKDGVRDPGFAPLDSDNDKDFWRLAQDTDGRPVVFIRNTHSVEVATYESNGADRSRVTVDGLFALPEHIPAWHAGGLFVGKSAPSYLPGSLISQYVTLERYEPAASTSGWSYLGHKTEIPADVRAIAHAPGGKLYVGGLFTRVNGTLRNYLVRLNADGSADAGFADAGGLDYSVEHIAVQPDGRVLVCGEFMKFNGVPVGKILRLGETGNLDTTFVSSEIRAYNPRVIGERRILVSENVILSEDGQRSAHQVLQNATLSLELPDRGFAMFFREEYFIGIKFLTEQGELRKSLELRNTPDSLVSLDPLSIGLVRSYTRVPTNYSSGSVEIPKVDRILLNGTQDATYHGGDFPTPSNWLSPSRPPTALAQGFGHLLVNDYAALYRLTPAGYHDGSFTVSGVGKNVYPIAGDTYARGFAHLLMMDDGRLLLADGGFWVANRRLPGLLMLKSTDVPTLPSLPTTSDVIRGTAWSLNAQVTSGGATSYQWSRNGVPIAGATNASFGLTSPEEADSGVYSVRVSGPGGFAVSPGTRLTVLPDQVPPKITAQPQSLAVDAGSRVSFAVTATGTAPLSYAWEKGGVALVDGGRLTGAKTAELAIDGAQLVDGGSYKVKVANALGEAGSEVARLIVVPAGVAAAHESSGWGTDDKVPVTVSVVYPGSVSRLSVSALLPDGWTYVSGTGEPTVKPKAGDAGALVWTFSQAPSSPVVFSYVLAVPMGQSGTKTIAAKAELTFAAGDTEVMLKPDPLVLRSLRYHSADTNGDWLLDAPELLRVLQLFGARRDGQRTGCYGHLESTVDGFAPDNLRAASDTTPLARYHSADSDRNGRLSLEELTRVIQLYNTRESAVRTGRYHLRRSDDPPHADGFIPGP